MHQTYHLNNYLATIEFNIMCVNGSHIHDRVLRFPPPIKLTATI